ncbi:MAG: hypothetical protein WCG11_11345 [Methylococcaceae bacterium]
MLDLVSRLQLPLVIEYQRVRYIRHKLQCILYFSEWFFKCRYLIQFKHYRKSNADAVPEFAIVLSGVKTLVAEDFIL